MTLDEFLRRTVPALVFFGISVALIGVANIVITVGMIVGWW